MTSTPVTFRGIPTAQLRPNPKNVRETLDGLDELAASIRANGILQPLIVNDTPRGLIVTDGHRRLAAAKLAQVPVIPCLVTTGTHDRGVVTTMLASAMHRELKPIEQARAFADLRRQDMTVADIARATGYSQRIIRDRLLLLDLPKEAQAMVDDDTLTIGQATDLAKQVRRTSSGTVGTKTGRSAWFTTSHRLAASIVCDHGERRSTVGGVACGQCWEAAIRADERGELEVTPPPHDEAAVQRALSGERMNLHRTDRLEATRRLVAQGHSDSQIADRLGVTPRQTLRDRQHLDLPSPIGRPGHDTEGAA